MAKVNNNGAMLDCQPNKNIALLNINVKSTLTAKTSENYLIDFNGCGSTYINITMVRYGRSF